MAERKVFAITSFIFALNVFQTKRDFYFNKNDNETHLFDSGEYELEVFLNLDNTE